MKVLITGATGFVGSAVLRQLLRAGYRVRALVRAAIERHLPASELARLKHIEELERETMMQFLEYGGAA